VTVEKGVQLVIPTEALHSDPQYFPEPDKFDPERFSEETKSSRHHYVYLPFGEGPRICIGNGANILNAVQYAATAFICLFIFACMFTCLSTQTFMFVIYRN
jgi:cytochrome P450